MCNIWWCDRSMEWINMDRKRIPNIQLVLTPCDQCWWSRSPVLHTCLGIGIVYQLHRYILEFGIGDLILHIYEPLIWHCLSNACDISLFGPLWNMGPFWGNMRKYCPCLHKNLLQRTRHWIEDHSTTLHCNVCNIQPLLHFIQTYFLIARLSYILNNLRTGWHTSDIRIRAKTDMINLEDVCSI